MFMCCRHKACVEISSTKFQDFLNFELSPMHYDEFKLTPKEVTDKHDKLPPLLVINLHLLSY